MNDGFPPLQMPEPERRPRREEKPRRAPLPDELLARRAEIAEILGVKVAALSQRLGAMSDEERRAVFYKLEHDRPITLIGTGLKPIVEPSPNITLAVPKEDQLNQFTQKLSQFGTGQIRQGHAPHQSFAFLTDIAEADPVERLSPELKSQYDILQQQEFVICEIEFFSLRQGANQQRAEIAEFLHDLRAAFAAGVHGTLFEHEMALPTCRAVIRCTGRFFRTLVEERHWIERIRWFEARPHFQTFHETWQDFRFQDLAPIDPPPPDAPIVCVIDSGLSIGNPFLEPVTRADLLRSYLNSQQDNPSDDFGHGSAVASLVSYYALNLASGARNDAKVWVAGARILNEHNQLEDDRLFSSLLREVVQDFVHFGVKVFCLAVGDDAKRWNAAARQGLPRKSWVARTIDQLSREYDVVFVTCTGNIALPELRDLFSNNGGYPDYFQTDDVRILDPGQAALALTVGSIGRGTQIVASASTPIALPHQPSPFTRSGPGIRDDTKPELVEYGGNLAFDGQLNRVVENPGLNVVTATHQLTPAAAHSFGTSFAAPRVAHRLAIVHRDLQTLGIDEVSAPLLKAFFVNSAQYPASAAANPRENFDELDPSLWLKLSGYGVADDFRATYCDDYSTILFFQGEIEPNQVLFFDVPVPADLVNSSDIKRMTVTLSHASEVQRWGLERYMGVDLKWRMFRGNVSRDDIVDAMSEEVLQSDEEQDDDDAVVDTDATSMPSELKFKHGVNRRSRGAIQHDVYEWRRHRTEYSDSHYVLAAAAYHRWQRRVAPVPLGVVVRLEEVGRTVQIYNPVQRVLAEIETRVRSRQ